VAQSYPKASLRSNEKPGRRRAPALTRARQYGGLFVSDRTHDTKQSVVFEMTDVYGDGWSPRAGLRRCDSAALPLDLPSETLLRVDLRLITELVMRSVDHGARFRLVPGAG
jgi:hypothetical protein